MTAATKTTERDRRFRSIAIPLCGLICQLLVTAAAHARSDGPPPSAIVMIRPPPEFDNLLQPQKTLADVYFGGRHLGQALVVFQPGKLRFLDVPALLKLMPDLKDDSEVSQALGGFLATHAERVCSAGSGTDCGTLSPPVAAIIFDEDQFRIDLFVNPRLLQVHQATPAKFLDPPAAGPSLVETVGATIAGSPGAAPIYNFQDRVIIASRDARLQSDFSYGSGSGLYVDDLVAEVDKPGLRYLGGLFWAPGADLVGHQKILGFGVGSQTDTRLDRESIFGSSLIVFLTQRSQVDILRDGRLLSTRSYEAGNQTLDTSALPDGSYDVVLRIREVGGQVREEHRFFIKNGNLPPLGQPIYYADAGFLVKDTIDRPLSLSRTPFFEFGAARRLRDDFGVEATILGTNAKVLGQFGGVLLAPFAQLRAEALVSTSADFGALVQVTSLGGSDFGYNFNLLRVWSRSSGPLLSSEVANSNSSFSGSGLNSIALGTGSFTQMSGSLSYRLGAANLGVTGTFRSDSQSKPTYSVGTAAYWPLFQRDSLQVILHGDLTYSNSGGAALFGIHVQLLKPNYALDAEAGASSVQQPAEDGGSRSRAVGSLGLSWQPENVLGGDLSASAGVERSLDNDLLRFSAETRNGYGAFLGDVNQVLDGPGSGTQYSLNFQTSAVANDEALAVGGRDVSQSAIVVRLDGGATGTLFNVLVDGAVQGQIRAGGQLPVFLPPYHRYAVQIRPVGGELVIFDGGDRIVNLYPGTAATLVWKIESAIAVYGRILWPDGSPVADAWITTPRGVGQTDTDGYFQMQATTDDVLTVKLPEGRLCRIALGRINPVDGHASLGVRTCPLPLTIENQQVATQLRK